MSTHGKNAHLSSRSSLWKVVIESPNSTENSLKSKLDTHTRLSQWKKIDFWPWSNSERTAKTSPTSFMFSIKNIEMTSFCQTSTIQFPYWNFWSPKNGCFTYLRWSADALFWLFWGTSFCILKRTNWSTYNSKLNRKTPNRKNVSWKISGGQRNIVRCM